MINIPGYRIIRPLGKGGMAEVYLAIQQSFEREVALKIMDQKQAEDEEYSQRFLREAKIVSRLVHPNIVTVYDVGIVDGHHFLSMEYVPGEDLKQARSTLSLLRSIEVIKDIAQALNFAGRKGCVHRDVKPENIMLQEDSGRAVLMDFGIARTSDLHRGMTQTGMAIGTPHYMSPEQARGREVDARSDLYSLGVVLFLLLTGYVPFDADSAVAVGIKHVAEPIPRLPEYLGVLQPVIDRALAKAPEDRFQTGAEFLAALAEITPQSIQTMEQQRKAGAASTYVRADDHAPTVIHQVQADAVESTTHGEGDIGHGHGNLEYHPAVHSSGGGAWAWLLGLLIAAGIGYGVYFQQQLPVDQRLTAVSSVIASANKLMSKSDHMPPTETKGSSALELEGKENSNAVEASPVDALESPVAPIATLVGASVDRASVDGSSSEAASNALPTSLDERIQQLASAQVLVGGLSEKPARAIEAAQIYRTLIERNPTDIEAGQGLQGLRGFLTERVESLLLENDFEAAKQALDLTRVALPEESHESRFDRLQERISTAETVANLLRQADEYLQKSYLTTPEESNAFSVLQQVVELEPENKEALARLNTIASRYLSMGKRQFAEGNITAARASIEKGLMVRPDYSSLNDLQKLLDQGLRLSQLQSRLDQQLQLGHVFSPAGDSALETLRQMLVVKPDQEEVSRRLGALEGSLVSRVESNIQQGEWDQARAEIARALAYFPESGELLGLKSINEAAMLEATLPHVTQLRLSGNALNGVSAPQRLVLDADKIIFGAFEYENFDVDQVVEARLYEGDEAIEVDRLVLPIEDEQGIYFFTLERPLQGFSPGKYRLDMVLKNKLLQSLTVEVEHSTPVVEVGAEPLQAAQKDPLGSVEQLQGASGILQP